jgi:hypothetical protein
MSSGGKGNSRANTSSQSSTTNSQTTVNQVDNRVFGEGSQVIEGSGNYVVSTDFNAIGSATELAKKAVDVADSIARSGLDLSVRSTQSIADLSRDALAENANTLKEALNFADQQTNEVSAAYHDASLTTSSLFDKALDYLGHLTGDTVTALNAISVEQNKSTDERVAEVSTNATKYTLLAISSIVIVGLIAYASRRS